MVLTVDSVGHRGFDVGRRGFGVGLRGFEVGLRGFGVGALSWIRGAFGEDQLEAYGKRLSRVCVLYHLVRVLILVDFTV